MKVNVNLGLGLLAVPVVLFAGYQLYKAGKATKEKAGELVDEYGQYVDPTDRDNFINYAFEWPLRVAGTDHSYGTLIYEWLHGDEG